MELDNDQAKFFQTLSHFIPPDMTESLLAQYKLILQYTALKAQRDQIREDEKSVKDIFNKAFVNV
jgi:hypothetical protein